MHTNPLVQRSESSASRTGGGEVPSTPTMRAEAMRLVQENARRQSQADGRKNTLQLSEKNGEFSEEEC